jgi:hypothetical protein
LCFAIDYLGTKPSSRVSAGTQGPSSGATIAATIWQAGTTIATAAICVLPIIPAVRINLEGAAGQGMACTTFAIGSVLAGTVFIELAKHLGQFAL